MEALVTSLKKAYPFSKSEIDLFLSKTQKRNIQKGETISTIGQICQNLFFLVNGSLRKFSDTESGDITIRFFIENDWVVDYQSFMSQEPAQYSIEALESCSLLSLDITGIHELVDANPSFFTLGKLLEQGTEIQSQVDFKKTPDERYKNLLNTHPEWVQRFPLIHIASYLGITPETLSRVRSRIK